MPDSKTYYLLEAYIQDRLSEAEKAELQDVLANKDSEEEIIAALEQYLSSLQPDTTIDKEALQHIWRNAVAIDKQETARVVPLKRRRWLVWAAAACILLVVGVLANVWLKNNKQTPPPVATTHDVAAPSNTRAVITLANGTKVYLDSASNGTIAQENNVNVIRNANGEVVYQAGKVSPTGGSRREGAQLGEGAAYNTLFNPRGSKVISLTLSDGTRVWLNSESSLKYPIAFASNTREVEITGEAYFEVKHNAKQPFKVHLPNGSVVEDIGTSFNINAYPDEEGIKTTLIEGKVRLSPAEGGNRGTKVPSEAHGREGVDLKPGEQAIQIPNSKFQITNAIDVDEITAWKNGYFIFNGATTAEIMRQVARWYDAEIVYEGNVKDERFAGSVPRTSNVSQLLKVLELTKTVRFTIEGKKITVKPY